ncbi:hypothetical protein RIF29_33282 [Crotalaria pallida]|uniref:Ycf3-interacting protein 1, chloroplastic n=1 Tax=Crotalaria pallida TaxID=3830 RepID=A0AAN9E859_CROPI
MLLPRGVHNFISLSQVYDQQQHHNPFPFIASSVTAINAVTTVLTLHHNRHLRALSSHRRSLSPITTTLSLSPVTVALSLRHRRALSLQSSLRFLSPVTTVVPPSLASVTDVLSFPVTATLSLPITASLSHVRYLLKKEPVRSSLKKDPEESSVWTPDQTSPLLITLTVTVTGLVSNHSDDNNNSPSQSNSNSIQLYSQIERIIRVVITPMASQPLPLTLTPPSLPSSSSSFSYYHLRTSHHNTLFLNGASSLSTPHRRRTSTTLSFVGKEDTDLRVSSQSQSQIQNDDYDDEATPKDLEYVAQIKRVLELLRKNRDMLFGEVKLTIMIEDPREVERRRLLGIEDPDAPTRDDLVAVLDEVNEGKIPKDKIALQMLAEELAAWPNIEVEAPKKKPTKSLYAKATDTGIDPQVVAKKLNVDWDSAAEIEETDVENDTEVPSAVGYGALYLVTAFPVIIGISVVLILFYNSLQ